MDEVKKEAAQQVSEKKYSKLAIWAFVLALLTPVIVMLFANSDYFYYDSITSKFIDFFGVVAIVVIPAVFAVIALRKASNDYCLRGAWFAKAAIILQIVWVLSFTCLPFMPCNPSLTVARAAKIHGLGIAMAVYHMKNDDYPLPEKWCDLLMQECEMPLKSFNDTEIANREEKCSLFALNDAVMEFGEESPSDLVLLFESPKGWNQHGSKELLTTEYSDGEGANVGFVDLYVEFVKFEDIPNLKWTVSDEERAAILLRKSQKPLDANPANK